MLQKSSARFRRSWLAIYTFAITSSLLLLACNREQEVKTARRSVSKAKMEEVNRILNQKDAERIEAFGERKSIPLKSTEAGLWYFIVNEGSGSKLTDGDKISMEYETYLLDGTKCYSSTISGPKIITLGESSIENGLDHGLRMLSDQGEATFILPHFLAYGLAGDDKKIPPRAVVVFEVKVKLIK